MFGDFGFVSSSLNPDGPKPDLHNHGLTCTISIDIRPDSEMLCKPHLVSHLTTFAHDIKVTKARAATLHLPHGPVQLPLFMPVATQGSLKGLTPQQLEETSCRLCLNNTYHLYDPTLAEEDERTTTDKWEEG